MFFGSLDAGNAITVDKPAFFLWPMEISARLFGLNGWSMLVPQALEGVAAVALLAAAVRRVAGHAAGLLAGAALAVTPVAVLMFRFDNPDAMLTLLLTAAGYATVRAVTAPGTRGWGLGSRWLALAGTFVGLAFITKMGQAFLVVPGLALAYLWAAPVSLGRRVRDLLGAGVAMVVAAGWWIAVVELWPASDRPYIGGSTTNSVLELAFGYNGLGRLFGGTGNGGGGGGGGGASFAGSPGITRLFVSSSGMATEISWLLPTSLLALVAGLWLTRRAPRTDARRALLIALGGWLIVTGLVFSYMQGTIHPYYAVALAPAIAGIVAVTGRLLWEQRASLAARVISRGPRRGHRPVERAPARPDPDLPAVAARRARRGRHAGARWPSWPPAGGAGSSPSRCSGASWRGLPARVPTRSARRPRCTPAARRRPDRWLPAGWAAGRAVAASPAVRPAAAAARPAPQREAPAPLRRPWATPSRPCCRRPAAAGRPRPPVRCRRRRSSWPRARR